MCSGNQPISSDIDPAGDDGDTQNPTNHFGVVTFDGNGTTNAVTGLGFKPDLIWGFTRSHGQSKRMVDSSRGGSSRLYSEWKIPVPALIIWILPAGVRPLFPLSS